VRLKVEGRPNGVVDVETIPVEEEVKELADEKETRGR
jgi:hypothetical protein